MLLLNLIFNPHKWIEEFCDREILLQIDGYSIQEKTRLRLVHSDSLPVASPLQLVDFRARCINVSGDRQPSTGTAADGLHNLMLVWTDWKFLCILKTVRSIGRRIAETRILSLISVVALSDKGFRV